MTARAEFAAGGATADLADRLAALGRRYDAAPVFPVDSLRLLAGAGLHRRFAPTQAGGAAWQDETARYAAMSDALRFVGRADLSVGRLYEGHVNALLLFGWYADPAQLGWLSRALDRGAWLGVWATEPAPGVRIAADDVLVGAKSFASGAGGLNHAIVTAAQDGGERRLVVVPADDRARADLSGWRVRGMRASVSGRYALDGLPAGAEVLLGGPGDYDREPRFTAGGWRFCAVQLGGVEALLTATRDALGAAARADPVMRARFADAVAATRTAGFWVAEASRRAASDDPDAVAVTQMTRGVVERSALDMIEAAARLTGTRSAFDGERVDKISRDLSLYLRQGGPDHARDQAALAWLERDRWPAENRLW